MAIIVSLAQYQTAKEQSELMKVQLSVEKQVAFPQMLVITEKLNDESKEALITDIIRITNQGGVAYEFKCTTAVFFEVTVLSEDGIKIKKIPINGYYYITVMSNDATGLLFYTYDKGNFSRLIGIMDDLDKFAAENGTKANIEVNRYVKLVYKDIFDEIHVDYLKVNPIFGSERIDNSEGESIFPNIIDSMISDGSLDFYTLSSKDLYDLATK